MTLTLLIIYELLIWP